MQHTEAENGMKRDSWKIFDKCVIGVEIIFDDNIMYIYSTLWQKYPKCLGFEAILFTKVCIEVKTDWKKIQILSQRQIYRTAVFIRRDVLPMCIFYT